MGTLANTLLKVMVLNKALKKIEKYKVRENNLVGQFLK